MSLLIPFFLVGLSFICLTMTFSACGGGSEAKAERRHDVEQSSYRRSPAMCRASPTFVDYF
jgi:preprotein translocase subunit Sec63